MNQIDKCSKPFNEGAVLVGATEKLKTSMLM